jgi:hypothetical protein
LAGPQFRFEWVSRKNLTNFSSKPEGIGSIKPQLAYYLAFLLDKKVKELFNTLLSDPLQVGWRERCV